jgi:hypothetical protein
VCNNGIELILSGTRGSVQHGITKIETSSGEKLYFHREVRGLNYDALSLSADSDPCVKSDPSFNFIYPALGQAAAVFYKFENGELHISTTNVQNPELQLSTNIKIVHHIENYWAMDNEAREKRLQKLDIPLDRSLVCN